MLGRAALFAIPRIIGRHEKHLRARTRTFTRQARKHVFITNQRPNLHPVFTDGDLDPNVLQESFWKFNARVGLGSIDGTWEVAAYARNLTDERVISFSLDAPLSAGIYANGLAEPRVYGLQARYNF